MIIVTTLALSSMCLHHLLLPVVRPDPERDLYMALRWARRTLIAAIIAAGYLFYLILVRSRRPGLLGAALVPGHGAVPAGRPRRSGLDAGHPRRVYRRAARRRFGLGGDRAAAGADDGEPGDDHRRGHRAHPERRALLCGGLLVGEPERAGLRPGVIGDAPGRARRARRRRPAGTSAPPFPAGRWYWNPRNSSSSSWRRSPGRRRGVPRWPRLWRTRESTGTRPVRTGCSSCASRSSATSPA
ncbi:MAG: hypothetical protein U5L11_12890 [Arhodomonas sp.]|nr:hypothetical protein [Arhodomonas sp.]